MSLDEKIAQADAAGLSYGKFVAQNYDPASEPETKPDPAEKPVATRICAYCGKSFPVPDKRKRLYCSDACRDAANRERLAAAKPDPEANPDPAPEAPAQDSLVAELRAQLAAERSLILEIVRLVLEDRHE